jgi:hypothetical protein
MGKGAKRRVNASYSPKRPDNSLASAGPVAGQNALRNIAVETAERPLGDAQGESEIWNIQMRLARRAQSSKCPAGVA